MSVRIVYLFGKNVLQRKAECGRKSTDQSQNMKGEFSHSGQQHSTDDGDERYVNLQQDHT